MTQAISPLDDVRSATLGHITKRLVRANGRRRERVVSLSAVLDLVRSVAGGRDFSFIHGGSVPSAYNYRAITTHALVARVDGRIFVGITTADAHASSPGRAFPCLQPWWPSGPCRDAQSKWVAWTQHHDVFELAGPQVDAILAQPGTE